MLSINPSRLYLIGDPKEPVEVWQKLRSQFQKKTWANKLVLRNRIHSLRLKEKESVQEHIKKMTELFNELDAIGAWMDEEDWVVQLLASLPESYDTLVTALEASEKVPSMEIVIDRLLYEEKKSKDRHGDWMMVEKHWRLEASQNGKQEYAVTSVENVDMCRKIIMNVVKERVTN